MREADLVVQRPLSDSERRVVREGADLDRLVAKVGQAARVDAVNRHVRARRGQDGIARRLHHRGRALMVGTVLGDDVVDVVVDAFADEENRLTAAVHRAEPLGDVTQRVEGRSRVEPALHVVGIVQRVVRYAHRAGRGSRSGLGTARERPRPRPRPG